MLNYCNLVSRTPPEGLWEWAEKADRKDEDNTGGLDTFGLVYEKVFVPDTTVDGMIGDRVGKKIPMVRCTCSACGSIWDEGYVHAHAPDGATYGFLFKNPGCNGFEMAASGDSMLCPNCGVPVYIKCKSKVGRDIHAGNAFVCSESYHMSVQLLPGEPGKKPLALIGWCMRRYCGKDGSDLRVVLPWDAYVFDKQGCVKLSGNVKTYSGSAGYGVGFRQRWIQQESWQEKWGADQSVYGLTEELLEESCLHNAKMMEYMNRGLRGSSKFPVTYLRLYQEHPNVENLVMQGATYLLDSLVSEQMKGYIWDKNVRGLIVLEDIDWEETRPSAMLGLDKDEFDRMKGNCWCPELLRLYLACRGAGECLSDHDIAEAYRLGEVEELTELAGTVRVSKTVRYLMRQIEKDGEKYLYDPEIDIYVDPEEFCDISVTMLTDYWRMARKLQMDLEDEQVKWPKDLRAAHDKAVERYNAQKDAITSAEFEKRVEELKHLCWEQDGILIRPCASMKELRNEGKVLHHCVATYDQKYATGQTAIFFIRRVDKPEEPYYTLELDEKELTVRQNRGLRNCGKTEEVQAFENAWLEWAKTKANKKKRKGKAA